MHAGIRRTALAGLLAGATLVLAGPALAAPGPTVSVRVEGENATLLPRTTVTTSTDPISHGDHCPGNTVAGAIEVATHGNWDASSFTQTILGETHDFSHNDYWSEWLNNKVGNGVCNDTLQDGDEVLILANVSGPPPNYPPTIVPLGLEGAPAVAQRGQPFTVTAVEYRPDAMGNPGTGTRTPTAGVTVSGGGATATTGADGRATLTPPANGTVSIQATKGGERSVPASICVHDAGDGGCGSVAGSGTPQAARDATGPVARIASLRSGRHYKRKYAPRLLKGTVDADPSGITGVYLRLWSHYRGRCFFYSGATESLQRKRCGADREYVKVGERADWSYLLPFGLPPGHYRLDVIAADSLGNGSAIAAGRNRVDFYVR